LCFVNIVFYERTGIVSFIANLSYAPVNLALNALNVNGAQITTVLLSRIFYRTCNKLMYFIL